MTTWYHWGPLRAIFGHFGVISAVRARGWSLELLHFYGHYRSQQVFKKLPSTYHIWGVTEYGIAHSLAQASFRSAAPITSRELAQ